MNEYQRQAYLSAMGVDSYMPRWLLANAPISAICTLPVYSGVIGQPAEPAIGKSEVNDFVQVSASPDLHKPLHVADVLRNLTLEEPKKSTDIREGKRELVAAPTTSQTIPAFTLSIWRPANELLVIDSRNTTLALPTELLLHNILRALYGPKVTVGAEDVLRWPLVDNNFVSRTIDDARSVLQVWLEVELERRPVKHLLLMGKNAAQYFLPSEIQYESALFSEVEVPLSSFRSIVSPSLIELLQQPDLKRSLWRVLQTWRVVN